MLTVTKEIKFCAGHRLKDYKGPCRNIHGHNYVVEVEMAREKGVPPEKLLDKVGILIDFKLIKEGIKTWIDENWDHAMLLNEADTGLIKFCESMTMKLYLCPQNPTAEWMSMYLMKLAQDYLVANGGIGYRVTRVRVYETDTCWAEATDND